MPPMTGREIIHGLAAHPILLLALFAALPVGAWLVGWIRGPGQGGVSPWRFAYSALVYLACIPGMGAAVLTGYARLFTGENLLDVNLLVYLLPVVSMGATLGVMSRSVRFADVPGFDRLSGLMLLLGLTFVVLLVLRRTFFGVFFIGSLPALLLIGVGTFALLKWSGRRLLGRK
jgi:hypothetical protein